MLLMESMDQPGIRLLFLWHMHQPYYKDLVTGEYRLPWVRLHALKDYYGMVKLLDEFPGVHQTFNLVPGLIAQIQDYVSGNAKDPFLQAASDPASVMGLPERLFAIQYLFQANPDNMIGRYPRYRELWQDFHGTPQETQAKARRMSNADLTDLQVLSQIAWMDEFFLDDPDVRELIGKGRSYTHEDQELVVQKQRDFLAKVLPAYAEAAQRNAIEISTSPFYHPILPLLCDTDMGAASHSGLPLPSHRFSHPEDAREQIARGLALHEQVFGVRPRGLWPSEGSGSNGVLAIAHELGLQWVATDEGVLGRSVETIFQRDGAGRLSSASAQQLYQIFRWQQNTAEINIVFRDHSLSDLIGFVYSGVPAKEAAADFIRRIKQAAEPLLQKGQTATGPIILDGENAWEYYPHSGREFLRRLYDGIQNDSSIHALTISEAIERESSPQKLTSIFPGSWINANFDIWIGAAEDNTAWDHLSAARDYFAEKSAGVSPEQRALAYEELLIAEGSDWNWWYGPEHHSANDRDFDELYRSHLANVYRLLGANPPDYLHHPISGEFIGKVRTVPQTAFIRPRIDSPNIGYFDWLGAASFTADRRGSSMHGKQFLLERAYAGIDGRNFFFRVDVAGDLTGDHTLETRIEVLPASVEDKRKTYLARFALSNRTLLGAELVVEAESSENGNRPNVLSREMKASFEKVLRTKVPLSVLEAAMGDTLLLRFSIFRDQLPLDSLPTQGWMELPIIAEEQMLETGDQVW